MKTEEMSLEELERQVSNSLTSWGNLDGEKALSEILSRFKNLEEKVKELEGKNKRLRLLIRCESKETHLNK
jgi:cell shape-determining protein MreC